MSDTEGSDTTVNAEGAEEVNIDTTPSETTAANEGAPSETGEGTQTPGE